MFKFSIFAVIEEIVSHSRRLFSVLCVGISDELKGVNVTRGLKLTHRMHLPVLMTL